MPTPTKELAMVAFNHPIQVVAEVTRSNDATVSTQYINLGNSAESGLLQDHGDRFDRNMLFDEPDIHELIFVATRGDDEEGAVLSVRLVDLATGALVFPIGGASGNTPFQGALAVFDLLVKNF